VCSSDLNEEETTETFETDDAETDKEFEKKLSKNEKTNKNIETSKVTKREKKDMDGNEDDAIANLSKMETEVKQLSEKFEGGIRLKDEDMSETKPLNVDFRNTKYSEEKMNPNKKAQMETHQLMDSIKQLETTMKSLNPVLSQGKKIMDMYENFKLD
jgi:paraquat-inducible protein B